MKGRYQVYSGMP